MNASDDAKFERARRERPHIEAFARLVREPPINDVRPRPEEPAGAAEADGDDVSVEREPDD